jgi:glycosyltransferase involved in cell wall biosynthesis
LKIKVLHVITRLIVGGAQENTVLLTVGQSHDPELEVSLYTGIDDGPEGNLYEEVRQGGIPLKLSKFLIRSIHPLKDLVALIQLFLFIKRGRFDIVHTHSSKAGVLGRIAARLAGTPVVVHTLHSLVFHDYQGKWINRFYIFIKRLCVPLTDRFISVCEDTRQRALRVGIGREDNHLTIFNGLNLHSFTEAGNRLSPAEAKERLGIPAEAPVVGKIARLFPLKGHDYFLGVAKQIVERRRDVYFLIVGNGILRDQLEDEVRRLGLAKQTVFTGLIPPLEIPITIQAMDVLVHTSLREGIARVIPQAFLLGKPVVAFDLDGAGEVVRHGVSGFLVEGLDTQKVAEYTLLLLEEEALRQRFGAPGREFVEKNFGLELMLQRTKAVYMDALTEKKMVPTLEEMARPLE